MFFFLSQQQIKPLLESRTLTAQWKQTLEDKWPPGKSCSPAGPPDCIRLIYESSTNPLSPRCRASESIKGSLHKPAGITITGCSLRGPSQFSDILLFVQNPPFKSSPRHPAARRARDVIICLFLTSLPERNAEERGKQREEGGGEGADQIPRLLHHGAWFDNNPVKDRRRKTRLYSFPIKRGERGNSSLTVMEDKWVTDRRSFPPVWAKLSQSLICTQTDPWLHNKLPWSSNESRISAANLQRSHRRSRSDSDGFCL